MLTRKRRSDAIDEAVVERVEAQYDFFSSFIPDKKAVSSKTLESKRILSDPISKVPEEFKKTNPDIQVSLSHFYKLRPNSVKTARQMKLYQSRCEYCCNAKLKLDVVNRLCEKHQ